MVTTRDLPESLAEVDLGRRDRVLRHGRNGGGQGREGFLREAAQIIGLGHRRTGQERGHKTEQNLLHVNLQDRARFRLACGGF